MAGTVRTAQRERTHARLLDAAIACLLEDGYAATTNQRIQERAGVSRGALLHHFPRKSALLVAAVHRVADEQLARLDGIGAPPPGAPGAFRATVMAVQRAMSGPAFLAAMELWAAARTDEELRQTLLPAERRLGHALRALLAPHLGGEDAGLEVDGLLALLRGLALTQTLSRDPERATAVVGAWVDRLAADGGAADPGRADRD
ncbi:TetR/AcrR family transcriptional regulator [Patulibacter sp. SYSU D01012]|uniref:TetR/AcrR family transcriptional regulator n=1 Tax=Patulibacter sp. SYSU D01012 TaxID=2817381 RepID=UPI001B30C431|nr:TetR/AcrR family transcriptional regulator [Patulibacter sp. SYSU D01012]